MKESKKVPKTLYAIKLKSIFDISKTIRQRALSIKFWLTSKKLPKHMSSKLILHYASLNSTFSLPLFDVSWSFLYAPPHHSNCVISVEKFHYVKIFSATINTIHNNNEREFCQFPNSWTHERERKNTSKWLKCKDNITNQRFRKSWNIIIIYRFTLINTSTFYQYTHTNTVYISICW